MVIQWSRETFQYLYYTHHATRHNSYIILHFFFPKYKYLALRLEFVSTENIFGEFLKIVFAKEENKGQKKKKHWSTEK